MEGTTETPIREVLRRTTRTMKAGRGAAEERETDEGAASNFDPLET